MSSDALGKKGKWMYCNNLYYVFMFLCKVDYDNDKVGQGFVALK